MKKSNKKIEEAKAQDKSYSMETIKTKRLGVFALISLVIGVGMFIVASFLVTQLLYDNGAISSNKFYENTSINGIDVSGMNRDEAVQLISAKLLSSKNEVEITLKYGEKEWNFIGSDFETNNNFEAKIDETFVKGRTGKIGEKVKAVRGIKLQGLNVNISPRTSLMGFDEKINEIANELNIEPKSPKIVFEPDNTEKMFSLSEGENGLLLNREELYKRIDNAFLTSKKITVEIPMEEVAFENDENAVVENIVKRSSFSTDYSSSVDGRKNNVNVALKEFNGMIVQPGQEVSFNDVTGEKTPEKGYQKAKIILNGVYVDGYGGGACQASTTLYNALILADLEILEVNPHSLPVSYVPLALDAMVSEGYSDLRFKNNLDNPIYIKTWGDETNAYVEIYGQAFEEGVEILRKAEFVGTIPHEGDAIVKDVNGEYADQITYAGEYLRIKYPREGYHSKAYLCYYKNGELVNQKLIRDEIYKPQKGLVMEGTEVLGEGMTLPENEVEIIPPESETSKITEISIKRKISKQNPSSFNP